MPATPYPDVHQGLQGPDLAAHNSLPGAVYLCSQAMLGYERLEVATGSRVVRPRLPEARWLHYADTLEGAVALDEHLNRLPSELGGGRFTAVVVGAASPGWRPPPSWSVDCVRSLGTASKYG
ncbi:hypothetical protein [Actinomadura sp. NPDC048394]|uniref:hypothetical protein n=1 Tax=Actinomadura sp. NPDC048394 TaxID=3158223 RepID=UPI0033EDE974